MADQRLTDYYESKYADESSADETVVVDRVSAPNGRFEGSVAALAPLLEGRDVLELAAGSGTLAQSLLKAGINFNSWTLSDIAENRLDGMRRRLSGDNRFGFEIVDAAEPTTSFGASQFDAVISVALIEHLIDPIHAMTDTRKLVKPGGFVYIDTPNIAKWTRRIRLALGQFPSTASSQEGLVTYDGQPVAMHDEGHLHYFTFGSLERVLIERCGYSRVERVPYGVGTKPNISTSYRMARAWPTMFAEISVIAYA